VAKVIPYDGPDSLEAASTVIKGIPSAQWINVMLAVGYMKSECLEQQQKLVDEFRTPIVRAFRNNCVG
jgi:hypothetical protein